MNHLFENIDFYSFFEIIEPLHASNLMKFSLRLRVIVFYCHILLTVISNIFCITGLDAKF